MTIALTPGIARAAAMPIAEDAGMGVRAPQDRGVEHARKLNVVGELRAPGRLVAGLEARRTRADRLRPLIHAATPARRSAASTIFT